MSELSDAAIQKRAEAQRVRRRLWVDLANDLDEKVEIEVLRRNRFKGNRLNVIGVPSALFSMRIAFTNEVGKKVSEISATWTDAGNVAVQGERFAEKTYSTKLEAGSLKFLSGTTVQIANEIVDLACQKDADASDC